MPAALNAGWQLAAGFNPLAAVIASAAAAMLLARRPGPLRWMLAVLVLLGTWFLADGAVLLAHVRESVASGSQGAGTWTTWVLWGAGGLAVGYLLPTWAGVFVGRRVTFGTGWASAGVVAASVSGLVQAIVSASVR